MGTKGKRTGLGSARERMGGAPTVDNGGKRVHVDLYAAQAAQARGESANGAPVRRGKGRGKRKS